MQLTFVRNLHTLHIVNTDYTRRCVDNGRFGSWMYSSNVVDLRENKSGGLKSESDEYSADCPSVVRKRQSKRDISSYECCPDEQYVDITINLQLAWR